MKFYFILFYFLICVAGCTNYEQENNNFIPDRLKVFMNKYFNKYSYYYEDINARGNHNYGEQYALFRISKDDLNQHEMEKIYNQLLEDGWRIIESNNKNYVSFCYGDNYSLDILFPLKKYEVTTTGVPIKFDDINSWNIFIYKSTTKIAECNQNSKDFIDFKKL
ncbi:MULTISPECIES: hypothetical protein [Acinetobacter]|uniref:hypothetical protein n=1 Tax=Acinetobacter TaxID=469 RepID=UPI00141AB31A|nr:MULTISPECIES: hypothetical protein [Acinetobacter]MCS4298973.1 hypothetical protein [Acinetobacter guillouiae]MCW2250380.1 hypothetical protein [Acinetobacter sp. BIGb0204]NII37523.1 hypothetical protein [Acinetobacter sp. BIGb0196]